MWPFRKTTRDINQLIYDYAEYRRANDEIEIYKQLRDIELFAQSSGVPDNIADGERIQTTSHMNIQIPHVVIQDKNLLLFFVNKNDTRLGSRFIGMNINDVFDMIEKLPHAHGLIFYNNKESFFGILRDDLDKIRQHLK